jgi:hypothetical protein
VLDQDDVSDGPAKSLRGRTLKRPQPFEPTSPPHAKKTSVTPKPKGKNPPVSVPSNASTSTYVSPQSLEALFARIESALVASEQRAAKAEKRLEDLEEFIRNQLFPRLNDASVPSCPPGVPSVKLSKPSPPQAVQPPPPPYRVPGINLDLSRVSNPELRNGDAGAVRKRACEALKERGVTCLGVNSKGNGRYRSHFNQNDVESLRRDDSWVRTHFDKGTVYGEQWYPVRVDSAFRGNKTDELGCTVLGRLNNVEAKKMRWLGNPSLDKKYSSLVLHVATKEEADRLLKDSLVNMPNGECAYTRSFYPSNQPAGCYKCHLYGHLHYCCKAPAPICGQCALPGHAASECKSTDFKCAACGRKCPYKATDPGCPVYRRELARLRTSPS